MLKKNMFYLVLISMFIISASFVMAETGTSGVDMSSIDLSSLEGTKIPSFLEPLFGDENINIHVTLSSGEVLTMGVSIKDAVVQEISTDTLEDASLDVYISQGVMEKLSQSENPASVFNNALSNKEIVYKANGLFNKIKYGIATFFMKFSSSDESSEEDSAIVDEVLEQVEEAEEEEIVEEEGVDDEQTVKGEAEEDAEEIEDNDSESEDTPELEDVAEEEVETESEDTTDGETETEDTEDETTEETESETEESEEESNVTLVEIDTTSFDPSEITIHVGDTVKWLNTRDESTIKTAMILGNRECNYIRSSVLQYGDTFQWTFTEPMTCTITDAIITTAVLTITVEP